MFSWTLLKILEYLLAFKIEIHLVQKNILLDHGKWAMGNVNYFFVHGCTLIYISIYIFELYTIILVTCHIIGENAWEYTYFWSSCTRVLTNQIGFVHVDAVNPTIKTCQLHNLLCSIYVLQILLECLGQTQLISNFSDPTHCTLIIQKVWNNPGKEIF